MTLSLSARTRLLCLLLVFCVQASACMSTVRVSVTGRDIHSQLPQLQKSGVARVKSTRAIRNYPDDTGVEKIRFDQVLSIENQQMLTVEYDRVTVRQLSKNCPPQVPFNRQLSAPSACLLISRAHDLMNVGTRREFNVQRTVASGLLVSSASMLTAGIVKRKDGALSTTLYISAGVTLLVSLLVSCYGRWGQSGCRD